MLVIFDCDGTLVDSEPIANRVLAEVVTEAGLPMTPAQSTAQFLGCSMAMVIEAVEAALGRPLPGDFRTRYRARLHAEMETSLEPIPGVRDVLDALEGPRCVASNGDLETVAFSLSVTGLDAYFGGRLYTAAQAGRGKPHPDLFLHAASAMDHAPSECLVVEDSLLGVRGARAAGMTVYCYAPNTGPKEDHREALVDAGAQIFTEMRALPALIARAKEKSRAR